MRTSTVVALAASVLSTSTDALTVQERAAESAKVVGMSLERRAVSDPIKRDRLRRRGEVKATLDNEVCGPRDGAQCAYAVCPGLWLTPVSRKLYTL
jgi:hypothetical protein